MLYMYLINSTYFVIPELECGIDVTRFQRNGEESIDQGKIKDWLGSYQGCSHGFM